MADGTTMKLPKFDGKKDSFMLWQKKFKAYANMGSFGQAIKTTPDPDLPTSATTLDASNTATGQIQIRAIKANDRAVAALTMALDDLTLMSYVNKSCTTDWPDGNAHLVMNALIKKFKPVDVMSRAEMKLDMASIEMKPYDDPSLVFSSLQNIEMQYRQHLTVEDKLATILSVCPLSYKPILTSEVRNRGSNLTIDDLEEAMTFHFRSMQFGEGAKTTTSKSEDDELAMMATSSLFCKYCKETTHDIKNCGKLASKNSRDKTQRFSGNCNWCGKTGHRADDCWSKPGNEHKKPEWVKRLEKNRSARVAHENSPPTPTPAGSYTTNESANAALDSSGIEFIMAGITTKSPTYISPPPNPTQTYCPPCQTKKATTSTYTWYDLCYDDDGNTWSSEDDEDLDKIDQLIYI